jgi:nucleoside triphosphate pyrophosphatase
MARLILASRSPQRRAILEQLGIDFEVRPADVEEIEEGAPEEIAVENARRKAEAVASGGHLVLGADTVVALGDRLYGKASTAEEARATLKALSDRTHQVIGGLCLIDGSHTRDATQPRARATKAITKVQFRGLGDDLIDWYLATGEWRERAGAYAIQGHGAALVERIEGDYFNVVGLPVALLLELEPGLLER